MDLDDFKVWSGFQEVWVDLGDSQAFQGDKCMVDDNRLCEVCIDPARNAMLGSVRVFPRMVRVAENKRRSFIGEIQYFVQTHQMKSFKSGQQNSYRFITIGNIHSSVFCKCIMCTPVWSRSSNLKGTQMEILEKGWWGTRMDALLAVEASEKYQNRSLVSTSYWFQTVLEKSTSLIMEAQNSTVSNLT